MIFDRFRNTLLPAVFALVLSSCGGGVGSGGTGDVAGGYGMGTVTGFGSVIVDGERYDDTGASVEYDTESGAPDTPARPLARADLAVGQRVELVFETGEPVRRASVFRISPTLVGPVTRLSPLQVAGQDVQTIQGDASRGPDTLFAGGLTSAQQIALGDRLEVHGVHAPDGIRATLVKRLPASQGRWLRLTGTVSGLVSGGRSFRLGELTVELADQVQVREEIRNGQQVQVWTREPLTGGRVVAERLRIGKRRFVAQQEIRLSGVATRCADREPSAYVCVGTTPVALADASFGAELNAGNLEERYVIVSGRFDAASGALGAARFSPAPAR